MLPKNVGLPTSTIRKILLWIFVIGFWFFFYWYRGIELSNKKNPIEKPLPVETPLPEKPESLNLKKQH